MPESQIILSQAAAYVATAPKSNAAYMGIAKAMKTVADMRTMPVPAHLQDKHYKGAEKLGHGRGYKYAHDYPNHYVTQQYLPDGMEGMRFLSLIHIYKAFTSGSLGDTIKVSTQRRKKHMSLTLEKIFEAKNRIAPYTMRTPLIRLEKLDEHLGCQVYLKAECMQITGAFKLRGAVNKIRMLTPEQLSCGIVAASSGNHGKAVAYTAKTVSYTHLDVYKRQGRMRIIASLERLVTGSKGSSPAKRFVI